MKPFAVPAWITVAPQLVASGEPQFTLSSMRENGADVETAIAAAIAYEQYHQQQARECLAVPDHEDASQASAMLGATTLQIDRLTQLRTRLADPADDGAIEMDYDLQSRIFRNLP